MKKFKAILSVFLCLMMLCACIVPSTAAGAESGTKTVAAKAPKRFSAYEPPATLDPDLPWDALFAAFDEVFFTAATSVDVSELEIPYDGVNGENWNYIQNHVATTPQFLGISDWTISLRAVTVDKTIISAINYSGDSEENAAHRAECEDGLLQLMRGIEGNDALSDYDKVLLLHDRLAAWTAYDYDNLQTETIPEDSYTVYGVVKNRVAVCQGYAMTLGWMFDKLGIENHYVTSNTLGHGWNKVKLDGKWYYLDATYDDPSRDIPGRVQHDNVLISAEAFKANHSNATDYDMTLADTDFETTFDKTSLSEIVKIGDAYYYLKQPFQMQMQGDKPVRVITGPAKLMKRTPSGETFVENELLTLSTYVCNRSETVEVEGEEPQVQTVNYPYIAKMTSVGSKIIFIDGKKVFAYDVSAAEPEAVEIFELTADNAILNDLDESAKAEFQLIGLQQKEGKIFVTAFNNSSFEADTVANYTASFDICDHANKTQIAGHQATTCTEAGNAKYICEDCRHIWEEDTEPGEHDLEVTATVAATCVSYEAVSKKCTRCDYTETVYGDELDPNNHPTDQVVDTAAAPATCQAVGYTAGTFCNACKKYVSGHAEIEKNANYHVGTYVSIAAKKATCTKVGNTEETRCTGCNEIVTASIPIEARGHDYVDTVVAPTCTKGGYTLHKCSRCWDEYKDTETEPTGHQNTRTVPAAVSTCITEGWTEGVYCDDCKTYVTGHKLLFKDPKNHAGEWITLNEDPTCEKDGVSGAIICSACRAYKTDERGYEYRGTVIPALGHDWDEGVVLKEATCTDSGIVKRTCATCGKVASTKTEKLDHIDADNNQICDRCGKNLNKDACPYCNQVHTGIFAPLVKFFHKIFYLFFGAKKAK